MYLDLDLHFSDGVSQAFASSSVSTSAPQVLTLSIHHAAPGFFPASPLATIPDPSDPAFDPFTLSLPLERGASDATFSRIWPLVERVKDCMRSIPTLRRATVVWARCSEYKICPNRVTTIDLDNPAHSCDRPGDQSDRLYTQPGLW